MKCNIYFIIVFLSLTFLNNLNEYAHSDSTSNKLHLINSSVGNNNELSKWIANFDNSDEYGHINKLKNSVTSNLEKRYNTFFDNDSKHFSIIKDLKDNFSNSYNFGIFNNLSKFDVKGYHKIYDNVSEKCCSSIGFNDISIFYNLNIFNILSNLQKNTNTIDFADFDAF